MNKIMQALLISVGAAAIMAPAVAQDIPTIRVGWTIPAEEAKYLMMKRPELFPDVGKTYKIEWSQFQGTSPMVQAMRAGVLDCSTMAPLSMAQGYIESGLESYIVAQHVHEEKGYFSPYWAVKKDGGDFDQFTGATITPRAVVKAVKHAQLFFRQHQNILLNRQVAKQPATASGE